MVSLKIAIAGGSGFVGRHLSRLLLSEGHRVVVLSREARSSDVPGLSYAQWHPAEKQIDGAALRQVDAVVNLAGAGIADKRWSDARKEELRNSRLTPTFFLHEALSAHAPQCRAFVGASAIGYYGVDRPECFAFHEAASPAGDFLARLCVDWEQANLSATSTYRCTVLRTGIVMGRDGGAYPRLLQPLHFGIRPIFGDGMQVYSWIHVEDLAGLYKTALINDSFEGAVNAVAPKPAPQRELMEVMARERGGFSVPFPVPAAVLRLAVGEAAGELLKSCTVSADKARALGFSFRFPDATSAMRDLAGARA